MAWAGPPRRIEEADDAANEEIAMYLKRMAGRSGAGLSFFIRL